MLPWSMKPVIGLISDIFPVIGYNKAPYILLTTTLGARLVVPNSQGQKKKKEPKPKLFGPDILRWGGDLSREGVGAKKVGMSSKPRIS